MVTVVQLVRMSDCGSEGRQFEPDQSPKLSTQAVEGKQLKITKPKNYFFYKTTMTGSEKIPSKWHISTSVD